MPRTSMSLARTDVIPTSAIATGPSMYVNSHHAPEDVYVCVTAYRRESRQAAGDRRSRLDTFRCTPSSSMTAQTMSKCRVCGGRIASTSISGNVHDVVGALEGEGAALRRLDVEPDTAPRHPHIEVPVRVGPALNSLGLGTARRRAVHEAALKRPEQTSSVRNCFICSPT